jgi:hypothetical protein
VRIWFGYYLTVCFPVVNSMRNTGDVKVSAIELEADRMKLASQMREIGIMGVGGISKDLEDYVKRASAAEGLSFDGTLERLSRGRRVDWIKFVGGFLEESWEKSGVGDSDAKIVVEKLYDDLRTIANPRYRRISELGGKKELSEAERDELGDLIRDDLELDKKTGFNMFKAVSPLLNDKGLRNDYASHVLAGGEGIAILGLGLRFLDVLMANRPENRGEDVDDGFRPRTPGAKYSAGREIDPSRSVGISHKEFQDASGVDLSKMVENMGVDPNTPEGEAIMFEVLTNPSIVSASRGPTTLSKFLLASTAHEMIEQHKKDRRRETKGAAEEIDRPKKSDEPDAGEFSKAA